MGLLGKKLIASGGLTPSQKYILGSMLRDAYDYRMALILAISLPPIVVALVLGRVDIKKHSLPSTPDFERFKALHALSIAAANPLCFLVFMFELTALLWLWLPVFLFRSKYSGAKASDMMVLANERIDRRLGYLPA